MALNTLYVPYNTKQIRPAYISKHNHKRDKQMNLSMITDNMNNWYYLAVNNITRLLRGITSNSDVYCLNCFHSYRTKNKLKSMKENAKAMIFVIQKCLMKTKKILKYNPGEKSSKASHL